MAHYEDDHSVFPLHSSPGLCIYSGDDFDCVHLSTSLALK